MATLKAQYSGAEAKEKAQQIVDQAAEKVRLRLATSIYGQDTLYLQKAIDAERYAADGTVSDMIQADMEAYGVDADTAVNQINQARGSVLSAMKSSETLRLKAKKDIRDTQGNPFDIAKQAKKDIENV
jgi:hypothetical protein